VVVGRRDTVLFAEGFGRLTSENGSPRPDPARTLFDLASLTKVVATASAAMVLVDRGQLDLDAPVARYLPRFLGGNKAKVTVRMLLDHTSGLPPYAPLYRGTGSPAEALDRLYLVPLRHVPGAVVDYSDLNAMLVGQVVEALGGAPLDRVASAVVFQPLGMVETFFAPDIPASLDAAPSLVRNGQPKPASVNDRNAAVLGGVAGHAGLFASGGDLARFAQAWLRRGQLMDGAWVGPATVDRFLESRASSGHRVLGWETPELEEPARSPYGRLATASTYGHTGWTGTFLWFDPVRDLFLVFLTNRSLYPTTNRSLRAMREVRALVSDAVSGLVPPRCVAVGARSC
jgi:CubicO group peptidase (beta-lactamase class C family)